MSFGFWSYGESVKNKISYVINYSWYSDDDGDDDVDNDSDDGDSIPILGLDLLVSQLLLAIGFVMSLSFPCKCGQQANM